MGDDAIFRIYVKAGGLFGPLKMSDSGFSVAALKLPRVAEAFAEDPATGINTTSNPGMLLLGSPGYSFGLGFLVRPATAAPSLGPNRRSRSVPSA